MMHTHHRIAVPQPLPRLSLGQENAPANECRTKAKPSGANSVPISGRGTS